MDWLYVSNRVELEEVNMSHVDNQRAYVLHTLGDISGPCGSFVVTVRLRQCRFMDRDWSRPPADAEHLARLWMLPLPAHTAFQNTRDIRRSGQLQ